MTNGSDYGADKELEDWTRELRKSAREQRAKEGRETNLDKLVRERKERGR
jgi:hypothetical protein